MSPAAATPASAWSRISRTTPGPWAFWRFNWIINRLIAAAAARTRRYAHGTLLDVGCGSMRARPWYQDRITRYLGIELPTSPYPLAQGIAAFARGEALPFRDGSIDTVVAVSMITCTPEPQRVIDEAYRVLSPGGALIIEFTQMVPVHDEPHDYLRFTHYAARWLLERAGFEMVECLPVGGLMTRVALSLMAPLNRINRGPTRVLTELPVRLLYIVIQLGFALLDRVWFDPKEVIANLVVARRPAPGRA
ncbi:MAG: class I SAM-dependent methyltransferase [Candidatus Eisenbacteria bacterium]|uniref:Class I SAM-dependent methyltransferase n=1 Tax=Eiseniibacteriota bacterium TaxID=2212470 RepID=A0A538UDY7_UNCEI|nr:MAG: class I SAM-dependent methyltransferase [Candidatus Eisenbacteria bacterium]